MLYITLNGGYRATDLSPPPSLSVCGSGNSRSRIPNWSILAALWLKPAHLRASPRRVNKRTTTTNRQMIMRHLIQSTDKLEWGCGFPWTLPSGFGMSNEPSRALKIKIRAKACDSARATDRQGEGKDRWTDRQGTDRLWFQYSQVQVRHINFLIFITSTISFGIVVARPP